jgi:hypothetical protein
MRGKYGALIGWVLIVGLALPSAALAGPYFGEWGWCWHKSHDCEHGAYCPLHYWAPGVYYVREYVHPAKLDQYPPGPYPPIPPSFDYQKYPCPTTAPAPTLPYADPTGYYGREIAPP